MQRNPLVDQQFKQFQQLIKQACEQHHLRFNFDMTGSSSEELKKSFSNANIAIKQIIDYKIADKETTEHLKKVLNHFLTVIKDALSAYENVNYSANYSDSGRFVSFVIMALDVFNKEVDKLPAVSTPSANTSTVTIQKATLHRGVGRRELHASNVPDPDVEKPTQSSSSSSSSSELPTRQRRNADAGKKIPSSRDSSPDSSETNTFKPKH